MALVAVPGKPRSLESQNPGGLFKRVTGMALTRGSEIVLGSLES